MGTQIEITLYSDYDTFDEQEFRVALDKLVDQFRDMTLEEVNFFKDDPE